MCAVAAVLLRFTTAPSVERAVAAHLTGLEVAAVAATFIWRSILGNGLLLVMTGILGVLFPLLAWQIPLGVVWIFLILAASSWRLGDAPRSVLTGDVHPLSLIQWSNRVGVTFCCGPTEDCLLLHQLGVGHCASLFFDLTQG